MSLVAIPVGHYSLASASRQLQLSSRRPSSTLVARRRRLAVAVVVVVAVAIALSATLIGGVRSATADGGSVAPVRIGVDGAVVQPTTALREYRVIPGDTLWYIAVRLAGDQDPRPMVDRLVQLNGLEHNQLTVGMVLLLPTHSGYVSSGGVAR